MYKIINSNKMSTFKDIVYKKNDDETWAEWAKRVPDNNDDKLDYIIETIYAKIYENDKEKAGKITGMFRCMDIEDLIPLLESEYLLDAQIREYIQSFIVTLTVAEMIEALSKLPPDAKLVMTESGFYSRSPFAEVMLPKLYPVELDFHGLTIGTQAYTIGHSHQWY